MLACMFPFVGGAFFLENLSWGTSLVETLGDYISLWFGSTEQLPGKLTDLSFYCSETLHQRFVFFSFFQII